MYGRLSGPTANEVFLIECSGSWHAVAAAVNLTVNGRVSVPHLPVFRSFLFYFLDHPSAHHPYRNAYLSGF